MMKEICPNLHNKQVAKEFGELVNLFGEETAHLLWSRNNGYSIDKAPNGADSILFGELLNVTNGNRSLALILKAKAYSNEFFNRFGDWTSDDKTNVSKAVDKNGEPKFNNGEFTNPNNIYESPQGGINMGAANRLSNIPQKGDISVLQQYLKSHKKGVASTALKLVIAAVNRYLNDNNTGIKYEVVGNLDDGEAAHYDRSTNTIRINKNAAFRNEGKSVYPEMLTITHELLHAITAHAIETNSRVRDLFLKLLDKTKEKLGSNSQYYGLSDVYEFVAELSNALFVEALKSIQLTRKETLLDRIKGILKKIYRLIFTSYKDFIGSDTVYSAAVEDLFAVMSNNIKKDENSVDTNRKTVYKSISAYQDKVDLINKQITNLYQQLYKNYKKQANKGANRLKREDSLWSTIKDLQSKDKKEASSIAIALAFELIGVYNLDPSIGVIPAKRTTVLGFLLEQAVTNFDNITAEQIFDMKSNIIDFYNDLCKYLFDDKDSLDVQDQLNVDKLSSTVHEINRLWRQAARVVGDKIVDENVDKYINTSQQEADEIKAVAKDWLHNNDMWGDEGHFTLFFNFSRQNSPIIKLAFLMIQDAQQEARKLSLPTLQKILSSYKKASSLIDKASLGNWQTEFMEKDRNGNFTGLFRSAVNRGLFKKDLEEFKQLLDEKWENKYGYTYITDQITGETLRSDTMSSIENETWNQGNPPPYVLYLLEVENWLCDHAHRRYSKYYYTERLSEPFDVKTGKGHGLSPRTLSRLKYIQDLINYILQKCTDKETGLVYPENLSQQNYNKLQMWKDTLQDLSNPFDKEGNRKTGEELQTALEIQAWNNWVAGLTEYKANFLAYDLEYQEIVDAIKRGEKTYSDLYRFIDANSEWGINPLFLEYVFGNNRSMKDYVTRMFLNSIKRLVKTKNGYQKDFSDVIFNYNPDGSVWIPDIWGYSRLADIKNNQQASSYGIDPDDFRYNFDVKEVPYTDPAGMYLSKDGVTKFDPRNNPTGLQPMTWFDYILNQYTDAVMNGKMDRFVSIDGSVGIDFSTLNGDRDKIQDWIATNILMYEKTWVDKKTGMMNSKFVPLSIFNQLIPKIATFGPNNEPTSRFVPKGRFVTKSGKSNNNIFDLEFSEKDRSGIQPDYGIYGDDEFVHMIQLGGPKAEYYKLLLDTMEQQWDKLGLDPSYNRYKLPLIEGTGSMKASRAAKRPIDYTKNAIQNAYKATSDDLDMRGNDDYVLRNGRWVLQTAPTRFINEMDDPSMISSDLAYTVGMFVLMTNNYLCKQKIQAKLETLLYNLDSENRDVAHQSTGEIQYERYQKMMKSLFYEQRETNEKVGMKPNKYQIAGAKAARMARSSTATLLLGYNLPSMLLGVWDSITQFPSLAARSDQYGFKLLGYSMLHTFPNLFYALANVGNPIPNCKAVAMMLKDGLVKTADESFKGSYRSRIRRALMLTATGGYTMGDYMTNMLGLRCAYEAKKYYPGNPYIEKGFYTKAEFDRLLSDSGLDLKQINKDWNDNHGESLWDAYYFENGIVKLKDEYKDVKIQDSKLSGAIQLTMSLLNGTSTKNDQSAVSENIIHKFFFLMRSYFIRWSEHWFAGYKPDNIARLFEDKTEISHRGSSSIRVTKRRKIPLTQEQKSRRLAYDYSTGEANPAVLMSLLRGAVSLLAIFNQVMFHWQLRKADPRTINKNEAKALREFVTWGLCLSLLTLGWTMFHRLVQDDTDKLKPDSYEESVPSFDNFTKQKVYLKMIDQVWFRMIDSKTLQFNPFMVISMVKTATTTTSAVEKYGSIFTAALDVTGVSGHDLDETITSDSKYKYFPRWLRALWTATPLNNIQTWSSWRGNDKVGRWYFDNTLTGTMFKGVGYDWKETVGNNNSDIEGRADIGERADTGERTDNDERADANERAE